MFKRVKKIPLYITEDDTHELMAYNKFMKEREVNTMPDLKQFKIYNWNAELSVDEQGQQEVEINFRIKGINKPSAFVLAFMQGKAVIDTLQSGTGSYWDVFLPLMTSVSVVQDALKKSK